MAKDTKQARLGMSFENQIESTNKHYSAHGLAEIQKIPTPWIVRRQGPKIVSAFPAKKSTVDFIGSYYELDEYINQPVAVPVAFEAKETTGAKGRPETNFPLFVRKEETVRPHQLEFLKRFPGHSFILINFKNRARCFVVPVDFIEYWYTKERSGGRKSIPFDEFSDSWKVNVEDYLAIIKK